MPPSGGGSVLDRPFRLIAFDWDGTAVHDRREEAVALGRVLRELAARDVLIFVVTGTHFGNLDRPWLRSLPPSARRRLTLATNRGSEIWGFDEQGNAVLLGRRIATPEEDRSLTEAAELLAAELEARGLKIGRIYDRLNRRKIDLIPEPDWADPPKSRIGPLLEAVQARLRKAGLRGLDEALERAAEAARSRGLPEARITTDAKHIEIGLTDKGDAVDWMMRERAAPRGLGPSDVLVAGDEFGLLDGVPGSDARMIRPSTRGAVFVSVGPEPGGVPPEVIPLGGGPPRFLELLGRQVALREGPCGPDLPGPPPSDPEWLLVEEGFQLVREHEIESLFAVSNGHIGVRGSLEEGTSLSRPATFVAGIFGRDPRPGAVPELFTGPDWVGRALIVEGEPLVPENVENLEHRRVLDLRQGILQREWVCRDRAGRVTRVRSLRLASMADRRILFDSAVVTPLNYGGRIRLESALRPASPRDEVLLRRPQEGERPALLGVRPPGGSAAVAFAVVGRLTAPWGEVRSPAGFRDEGAVTFWEAEAEMGRSWRLDRFAAAITSRETDDPVREAERRLAEALAADAEDLAARHVAAWSFRWEDAEVAPEGSAADARALRFAVYHLIGAADPEDPGVSVGARGLTGGVYKGHVFWDTETFMAPFYAYTHPDSARALLLYRHRTLEAARRRARAFGYRGALYAWESADSGEDTTPPYVVAPDGEVIRILSGEQEHHISADVAYAVDLYRRVTGDEEFFTRAGAEILFETARFWKSRVEPGEDGLLHIRHVVGPDEYHEDVDDDAYTNGMARWNLEAAADAAEALQERHSGVWRRLADRLELGLDELRGWREAAARLYTGWDPQTGLFEQFRGYFGLEFIDPSEYVGRTLPLDVLLGRERVRRSQIIKQADVLMLIHLLWDRFPPEVREANYRYYEPRTGHGSSLSPPVHAALAARLGRIEEAARYFRQTGEIDLADNMGNAAGGVHLAAQGGLWQAAVFGFAGLRPPSPQPGGVDTEDAIVLDPHLPPAWRSLRFALRWRGRRVVVTVAPSRVRLEVKGGAEVPVAVGNGASPEAVVPGREALWERRREGVWRREVA
ncbi:MAG TPA: glycosyl hydrolase family 65 protein [Planctomycetota bacterium]|nr:glycosyl hydrolase family 65 protein [Planctomycetota bacterium]